VRTYQALRDQVAVDAALEIVKERHVWSLFAPIIGGARSRDKEIQFVLQKQDERPDSFWLLGSCEIHPASLGH
jgi:hypothetical protein